MKKQSNTISDYMERVIKKSWTWEKLTDDEKKRFLAMKVFDRIKGSDAARIEWLNTIYSAFLDALEYKPIGWREAPDINF